MRETYTAQEINDFLDNQPMPFETHDGQEFINGWCVSADEIIRYLLAKNIALKTSGDEICDTLKEGMKIIEQLDKEKRAMLLCVERISGRLDDMCDCDDGVDCDCELVRAKIADLKRRCLC